MLALALHGVEGEMRNDPVKVGTLLRPLARNWFRGPATRDRDVIVMDGRRGHAESYEPMLEPRVGLELARVRTPDDAVRFVTRFGVLGGRSITRPPVLDDPWPAEYRQPFTDFERAAEDLRQILRTVQDVRKATEGDQTALARIKQHFGPPEPDSDLSITSAAGTVIWKARDWHSPEYFTRDDRAILIDASDWAATGLMQGLNDSDARPYVFEPAQLFPGSKIKPGGLRTGILTETLLGFCYLSVAQVIASEPLATCDECNRAFIVDDKRQRFCEAACANRARFRRFKNKQSSTKKRGRHGKTTRTR
jgi:hypothetical protein